MHRYQPFVIRSLAEFRQIASLWDDLWLRSETSSPAARAESVARWVEHFAPQHEFRAVVLIEDARLVAALPLVGQRMRGFVEFGALPVNCFSTAGRLLLDPSAHRPLVGELLCEALAEMPWPLLWFEQAPSDSAGWRALLAAAKRQNLACEARPMFPIGTVEIGGDYDEYLAQRSGNHRRSMRRAAKRAHQLGDVRLVVHDQLQPHEVEPALRAAFEIEDRSWKGEAGTSVLREPGLFDYYVREAHALAEREELRIAFLDVDGRHAAFEYGWQGKGVYFSPKVGYDETFAEITPGQLLRDLLLERFHQTREVRRVDFQGPLTPATEKWATGQYDACRVIIAPRRVVSRVMWDAYQLASPWLRRLRGAPQSLPDPFAEDGAPVMRAETVSPAIPDAPSAHS